MNSACASSTRPAATYTVQEKIEKQIDAGFKAEKLSRQTLIREQMNTVVSEVRLDVALADLQNAYANVYASHRHRPGRAEHEQRATRSTSWPDKLRNLWAQRDDSLASCARNEA